MSTSLNDVIEQTVAKFGSGTVCRLTDKRMHKMPVFKTGIPLLDKLTGVGGLPKGRIIEVAGPESAGKTSIVLTIVGSVQKQNGWAWYGDMEHSLDPVWAEKLGVDLDKMLVSQPDCAEQCLDIMEHMIMTGVIDVVVVDSVASLVPKAELDGEAGDVFMGLQARLMSQAMRKLTSKISKTDCLAIFTNQIREKIGQSWGSNETSPGGRALKFYSSIRLDIRRIGAVKGKKEEDVIGNTLKLTIKKNKVGIPFKIGEVSLLFKNGFDFGHNMLGFGVDIGIIKREGNTYSWEGEMLGKNKGEAIRALNSLSEEKKIKLYDNALGIEVEDEKADEVPAELPKEENR